MRKIECPLYAAIVVIGLFTACVYSPEAAQETPEGGAASDMAVYYAKYRLRVVNNTDDTVVLYDRGAFHRYNTSGNIDLSVSDYELCTVADNAETGCEFLWQPKYSLYYSDIESEPDPPAEKLREWFEPETHSFYLTLGINGEEYYLVGWPETIELSVVKAPGDITLPRDKIVQYGIGYSENTEVRIKQLTYEPFEQFAYVPFTIKYDGQPQEYDFDDVLMYVYGDAVLTINSSMDIHFETLGLGLEPF